MKKLLLYSKILNGIVIVYLFALMGIVVYNANGEGAAGYAVGIIAVFFIARNIVAKTIEQKRN